MTSRPETPAHRKGATTAARILWMISGGLVGFGMVLMGLGFPFVFLGLGLGILAFIREREMRREGILSFLAAGGLTLAIASAVLVEPGLVGFRRNLILIGAILTLVGILGLLVRFRGRT